MHFIVAGGTGFIGRALCESLTSDGHAVTVLTRGTRAPAGTRALQWNPNGQIGPWSEALDGCDGVINLAGESIAARRWSNAQKERIRASRVLATRSLVAGFRGSLKPPRVLVSGSAEGYYAQAGDTPLTEEAPGGDDFLGQVCREWEAEALKASDLARVALIRTGIVLERDGGALAKMLLPFRLFVGGPLGNGEQWMPWIHRADLIGIIRLALESPTATGPLNGASPNPVRNRDFVRGLGRALNRPALLQAPGFALRLLLGEMADALLLRGHRLVPKRALDLGYHFKFPTLDGALSEIFEKKS